MARTTGSDGKKTALAIRRKTLSLIARHGYGAVSMRMIADAVGVQVGALYNHYPNKQALLRDLLMTHMEQLLAAWAALGHAPSSPATDLERITRFHIGYHLGKPEEVFISYMELRSLEPENFKRLTAMRAQYEGIVRDIVKRGAEDGSFVVDDYRIATMAIVAMLTGATTWFDADGRLTAQEIEDIYARLVLRSVGCSLKEEALV